MAHESRNYTTIRGDKWNGPEITFKHQTPTFDFTGTVVKCELRDRPKDGTLIYTFTLNPDVATLGVAKVTLLVTGAESASFPIKTLYGDVQIEGPGDFGPYTSPRFTLQVLPDITI